MSGYPPTTVPKGRPRVNLPIDRVRELSALGLSQEQAAYRLGCAPRTFGWHLANDPTLKDAWLSGKANAIEDAARTIWQRGMNGSDACLIFWLKCQANWAPPKQDIKITMTPAGPLIDGHVTDIALEHSKLLDGPNPDDIPDIPDIEIVG